VHSKWGKKDEMGEIAYEEDTIKKKQKRREKRKIERHSEFKGSEQILRISMLLKWKRRRT
jgi:hypothetical protein